MASICLIAQTPNRASLQLASALGADPVAMRDLSERAFRERTAIVVDIDLADLPSVAALREGLKTRAREALVIVAIDAGPGAHRARAQANAIGATNILTRPLVLSDIRKIVADERARNFRASAAGPSIIAAAGALGHSFKALNTGAKLDMGEVQEAGAEALDGVNAAGLGPWLDQVRGHHEGTYQHCLLVTGASVGYAQANKLPEPQQHALVLAALLHDIGKASIDRAILDKPGKLSEAEFAIIKTHPLIGARYLREQNEVPAEIIGAVEHHHEYINGVGYPHNLRGVEIDRLTRILTVCDVYAALIERRSYKEPKSPDEAIAILGDMALAGNVEFDIVRNLGRAVGVEPAGREYRIA